MTKDDMLQFIEQIDGKLAELRRAVEQLPETVGAIQAGTLPEPERENIMPPRSQVGLSVDKAKLCLRVTESFEEMHIRGEPVGAERVQAMIEACGVKTEGNAFSRDIVEMREE